MKFFRRKEYVRKPWKAEPLPTDELDAWLDAARSRCPESVHNMLVLVDALTAKHPFKTARMRGDILWLIKEGEKMGFDWNGGRGNGV